MSDNKLLKQRGWGKCESKSEKVIQPTLKRETSGYWLTLRSTLKVEITSEDLDIRYNEQTFIKISLTSDAPIKHCSRII